MIAQAEGESSRFLQTLAEYEKAPVVTRKRLYLDAMETVFANTSKVVMQVKDGNSLMYLPLDKLMENTGGIRATPGNAQILTSQEQDEQDTIRRRTSSRDGGGR